MAGSNPNFDPAAFRSAIHFAMTLGLPNKVADRATFRWSVQRTYAVEDTSAHPYDWTEPPATTVVHADVQVPVAVKQGSVSPEQTDVGEFNPNKVELTLLDTDFVQVEGASVVILGGHEYDVDFVAPPVGLFDVDVYTIYATARDVSGSVVA